LVAADGSVTEPNEEEMIIMGAGIYPHKGDGLTRAFPVRGEVALMLPEGAAIEWALMHFPQNEPLAIATDCAVMMYFIQSITRDTFWKTFYEHRFEKLLVGVAKALHKREAPTIFIKVKAHQGQELNEGADRMANKATVEADTDAVEYGSNSRYQAAEVRISETQQGNKDPTLPTRVLVREVLPRLKTAQIERHGQPDNWTATQIRQRHIGNSLRATALTKTGTHGLTDRTVRHIMQAMGHQFPSNSWLHKMQTEDNSKL
jgi:hypothetical protein